MFKTRLKLAVLLFVPMSGLSSCAEEKSKGTHDNFKIGAALVRSGAEEFDATQSSQRIFPVHARLRFEKLSDSSAKEDSVELNFDVSCESAAGTSQLKSTHKNVSSVRLQDLMPPAAFVLVESKPTEVRCTLGILAKNKIGSTQEFKTPLSLKVLSTPEDGDFAGLSESENGTQVQKQLFEGKSVSTFELRRSLVSQAPIKSETRSLMCEGFWMKLDEVQEQADFVGEKTVLEYDSLKLVTPKEKSNQLCRVVTEKEGDSRQVRVSRLFKMQFEVPLPVIKQAEERFITGYLEASANMWLRHRQSIQVYTIENPTQEVMDVAVPINATGALRIFPVSDVLATAKDLDVELVVSGSVAHSDGFSRFQLAPGVARTITAYAQIRYLCEFRPGTQSSLVIGTGFNLRGFFYRVDESKLAAFVPQGNQVQFSNIANESNAKAVPLTKNLVRTANASTHGYRWAPYLQRTGGPAPEPEFNPESAGAQSQHQCRWF